MDFSPKLPDFRAFNKFYVIFSSFLTSTCSEDASKITYVFVKKTEFQMGTSENGLQQNFGTFSLAESFDQNVSKSVLQACVSEIKLKNLKKHTLLLSICTKTKYIYIYIYICSTLKISRKIHLPSLHSGNYRRSRYARLQP